MAKIGVEIKIDVTKIDKARLYRGEKGTYLTMTAFIDPDNKDQYDNNGMVTHKKYEGEDRAPILGNTKVFWSDNNQAPQNQGGQQPQRQQAPQNNNQNYQPQNNNQNQAPEMDSFDEDIPF